VRTRHDAVPVQPGAVPRRRTATAGPRVWGRALIELALPVSCPGCGEPGVSLCPACAARLAGPCRVVTPPSWGHPLPVWAGPDYEGPASRVIVAWKDRGRLDLTPALARTLAGSLAQALPAPSGRAGGARTGPVLLVPAASTAAAVRRRGEDVVALLVRAAAEHLRGRGRPAAPVRVLPVLRLRRGVADQAGLGAAARRHNVTGRVRLARGSAALLRGQPVLLVDDVVTTGATLCAAGRALTAAGATVLGACTVCATPPVHRQGVGVSTGRRVD